MSMDDNQPNAGTPSGGENPTPQNRSAESSVRNSTASSRLGRKLAWFLLGVIVLLIVLIAGVSWYSTTEDFQHRVSKEIVSILENATGGRVEVHGVAFSLWHLAIEVNGLVIHGLEGAGEAHISPRTRSSFD